MSKRALWFKFFLLKKLWLFFFIFLLHHTNNYIGSIGGVVGQRRLGPAQNLEDGIPVVEEACRYGKGD